MAFISGRRFSRRVISQSSIPISLKKKKKKKEKEESSIKQITQSIGKLHTKRIARGAVA